MRGLLTSLLISAFPFLCADDPITPSMECRLNAIEHTIETRTNASALMSPGLFLFGDALYWQAREGGIPYGMKVNSTLVALGNDYHYDIKEPEFEWNFGFRLGLGYGCKRDGWDFSSTWTRYSSKARDTGILSSTSGIIPIFANPDFIFLFGTASNAEAHWHLQFNQLDVLMGRSFHVSRFFSMRPFIGPTGIWIDQHYQLEYVRRFVSGTDHVKLENVFKGVGLMGGCDLWFGLGRGWSILGKGSASLYAGFFDLDRHEHYTNLLGERIPFTTNQTLHLTAPTTALSIGFAWDRYFSNQRYYASFKVLFDYQIFFNQNQFSRFVSTDPDSQPQSFITNQGDLTFFGGSFSALFGF
jgi:hypothetical protein